MSDWTLLGFDLPTDQDPAAIYPESFDVVVDGTPSEKPGMITCQWRRLEIEWQVNLVVKFRNGDSGDTEYNETDITSSAAYVVTPGDHEETLEGYLPDGEAPGEWNRLLNLSLSSHVFEFGGSHSLGDEEAGFITNFRLEVTCQAGMSAIKYSDDGTMYVIPLACAATWRADDGDSGLPRYQAYCQTVSPNGGFFPAAQNVGVFGLGGGTQIEDWSGTGATLYAPATEADVADSAEDGYVYFSSISVVAIVKSLSTLPEPL